MWSENGKSKFSAGSNVEVKRMASILLKLEIKLAGKKGTLDSFMKSVEGSPKPKRGIIQAEAYVASEDEFNSVYTANNRSLIDWIRKNNSESVYAMAKAVEKDVSNLTKTLRALAKFSLVRLEEGETARKTLRAFVDWNQLEVRFPPSNIAKVSGF